MLYSFTKSDAVIPLANPNEIIPPVDVPTNISNISLLFLPKDSSIFCKSIAATSPLIPPPSTTSILYLGLSEVGYLAPPLVQAHYSFSKDNGK